MLAQIHIDLNWKRKIYQDEIFEEILHRDQEDYEILNLVLHSERRSQNGLTFRPLELNSIHLIIVLSFVKFCAHIWAHLMVSAVIMKNRMNTILMSSSHLQCYRRCLINYCWKHFNCYPVFIDYSINELDLMSNQEYNETNICFNNILRNSKK